MGTRNLCKSYGRGKQRFEGRAREVSLTPHQGEVAGFFWGPNGVRAKHHHQNDRRSGTPRWRPGHRCRGRSPPPTGALRKYWGRAGGHRNLYLGSDPEENQEYFGDSGRVPRKVAHRRGLELLARFGLQEKRNVPVQKLSRGMQQKVAIAVALIHHPQLLLLDEPTLGLDVEAGETVKALVRQIAQEGRAILLTTHQLDVAEALSDRVAIIRRGRIIAEQKTEALLREFSDSTYRLEVEGTPLFPTTPDRKPVGWQCAG